LIWLRELKRREFVLEPKKLHERSWKWMQLKLTHKSVSVSVQKLDGLPNVFVLIKQSHHFHIKSFPLNPDQCPQHYGRGLTIAWGTVALGCPGLAGPAGAPPRSIGSTGVV
jgi:hypothetical protein